MKLPPVHPSLVRSVVTNMNNVMQKFLYGFYIITILLCTLIGCTHTPIADDGTDTDSAETVTVTDAPEAMYPDMVDRVSAESTDVRSGFPYTVAALENPTNYAYDSIMDSYMDDDGFHILVPSYDGHDAWLTFDTNGELLSEIVVPTFDVGFGVSSSRLLTDGTWLLYGRKHTDGSMTAIWLWDSEDGILGECTLSDNGGQPAPVRTTEIHVTEKDDGTRRIFVSEWGCLYYLDEQLHVLSRVSVSTDYAGAVPLSDGVYLLGDTPMQMCRADMNTGTATAVDSLPVPTDTAGVCDWYKYGHDGLLYCLSDKILYQYDESGIWHKRLCFPDGSFNGHGEVYLYNGSAIFYQPCKMELWKEEGTLSLLTPDAIQSEMTSRKVLTVINISNSAFDVWLNRAVAAFNNANDTYQIKLRTLYYTGGMDTHEQLQSDLLENGTPDMILFPQQSSADDYIDKALFLDLSPYYGDSLLGGVTAAYTSSYKNDAMYVLPVSMTADTYATAVTDGNLTWDILREMCDTVAASDLPDAVITNTDFYLDTMLFADFYDTAERTVSFDTEAFFDTYRVFEDLNAFGLNEDDYGFFSRSFSTDFQYGIAGEPAVIEAVRDGTVKLLGVPFDTIEAYAALKRIFDDTPFTLCGYPTANGTQPELHITSQTLLSVCADSDLLGGCDAFIRYLLSDEVQTSADLIDDALPVTASALRSVLENYRYVYYKKEIKTVEEWNVLGTNKHLVTQIVADAHAASPIARYAESSGYAEIVLSDAELDLIFDHFNTCTAKADINATIGDIIHEELSAYTAGVRTLEEAAKIIQSRVFIYINE